MGAHVYNGLRNGLLENLIFKAESEDIGYVFGNVKLTKGGVREFVNSLNKEIPCEEYPKIEIKKRVVSKDDSERAYYFRCDVIFNEQTIQKIDIRIEESLLEKI